jgi:hypothetical protein
LLVPVVGISAPTARAFEQEPSEVVEVCFRVTADAEGTEVLGEACTDDES